MVGLTNIEVEKLGKKLLGSQFIGVYPADSIPSFSTLTNKSIIFNLSKHTQPGSHYIAVLFTKKAIFYFDSYGKKLTNKSIKNNLKRINLPIFYHTRSIQDPTSIFCGLFSLSYLHAIQNKKMSPQSFYKMFKTSPKKQNDKIVTKFLMLK